MNKNSKIYVAGHTGMVGSAIYRYLLENNYSNIIVKSSKELDLMNQQLVEDFFKSEQPEYVFLAAAKVGGIIANNSFPAEFLYNNLMIESNVIHFAYKYNAKKLLFLASSCIYPKFSTQPIIEEELMSGYLEPTNEAYAVAKIAGIELCKFYRKQYGVDFISVMPTSIFGINDNFDINNSHVIPAMIRKFYEAKQHNKKFVELWGTGTPRREFLYVDDLADACVFLMQNYSDDNHINIGTGTEITIKDLATQISKIVGFEGSIIFDSTKPDGTPRKLLNSDLLNSLGWQYTTNFNEGLEKEFKYFLSIINK